MAEPDGFWDRNQRFNYLVARENARRIVSDPGVVACKLAHLEKFAANDPGQAKSYRMWKALLALRAAQIAAQSTERSDHGDCVRATAPAFGALAPSVRAELLRKAQASLTENEIA